MIDSSSPEVRTFHLASGKAIRMSSADVYAAGWLTKEFDLSKTTIDTLRKKGNLKAVKLGDGFVTGRNFFDFIDRDADGDAGDE